MTAGIWSIARRTSRRSSEVAAGVATLIIGLVLRVTVGRSDQTMVDHTAFLATIARMRAGASFYPAFQQAFLLDVDGRRLASARDFREPFIFVVWRWIPDGALYLSFLVMAAVAAYLIARASTTPLAGLAVGAFLVFVGRTPMEEWLIVEMWCVLPLAGAFWAWRRERYAWSAAFVVLAFLIRETCVVVLVAALVIALVQHKPLRPWLIGLAVCGAAYGAHAHAAATYVFAHGDEAQFFGTGRPPATMIDMEHWPFPILTGWAWVLLAAWAAAALVIITRRARLEPIDVLFGLPLFGLVAERPYWGLLATPFALALAAELCAAQLARLRRNATTDVQRTSFSPSTMWGRR